MRFPSRHIAMPACSYELLGEKGPEGAMRHRHGAAVALGELRQPFRRRPRTLLLVRRDARTTKRGAGEPAYAYAQSPSEQR